jgi:hypothetical protein
LHDVSFAVPRRSRIALVGPSGAGKSTMLALIERFYDVTGGTVRVDGHDVRDLPRAALRARLGYVEQEAPVPAGSLRDNLLLTAPGATDAELRAALDQVNLGALAERAPEGLDVQVGEGGVLLSGGERQRLAIATATICRTRAARLGTSADEQPRRPQRGRAAAGDRHRGYPAHADRGRAPAQHGGRLRPDRRARPGPGGRDRPARAAAGDQPALPRAGRPPTPRRLIPIVRNAPARQGPESEGSWPSRVLAGDGQHHARTPGKVAVESALGPQRNDREPGPGHSAK